MNGHSTVGMKTNVGKAFVWFVRRRACGDFTILSTLAGEGMAAQKRSQHFSDQLRTKLFITDANMHIRQIAVP